MLFLSQKFRSCLLEMLLNSRKVKIDGLGTFYCTMQCKPGGALKEEDFKANQNVEALHIRFLPEQEAENNISSREFLKKAEFIIYFSIIIYNPLLLFSTNSLGSVMIFRRSYQIRLECTKCFCVWLLMM